MRLGLWIALVMISSAASAGETLSEAQIWKKTKLSAELTAKFINNQDCRSSELYEQSCRKAITAAYELLDFHSQPFDHDDFELALKQIEQTLPSGIPPELMRARAINAHLAAFDPYAAIKASEEFRNTQTQKNKNYVGIGMAIESTPAGLRIRETYPTSPAGKAGLREGDMITAIAADGRNFEDATHFNPDQLADKVVGENGEPLAIRINRQGREIEYQNIKRAAVKVTYMNSQTLDEKKETVYLRIRSFESLTIYEQVARQLREYKKMKRLILDLRGNQGGDKFMATQIAELFLGSKRVTGTRLLNDHIPSIIKVMNIEKVDYEQSIDWEGGYGNKALYKLPIVVLVDSLTASAGELLAGALQDHEAAWLVGERTYGKGSGQSMESIPDVPQLTLKWTSERFYLPSGRSNQGIGVMPSFEVPRNREEDLRSVKRVRELDIKPNSLKIESQAWQETRPSEQARIARCLELNPPAADLHDYQLAYALGVLSCQ